MGRGATAGRRGGKACDWKAPVNGSLFVVGPLCVGRVVLVLGLAGASLANAGCNSILGNDDHRLAPFGAAGADGSPASDGSAMFDGTSDVDAVSEASAGHDADAANDASTTMEGSACGAAGCTSTICAFDAPDSGSLFDDCVFAN
jgi:hypothetical protein